MLFEQPLQRPISPSKVRLSRRSVLLVSCSVLTACVLPPKGTARVESSGRRLAVASMSVTSIQIFFRNSVRNFESAFDPAFPEILGMFVRELFPAIEKETPLVFRMAGIDADLVSKDDTFKAESSLNSRHSYLLTIAPESIAKISGPGAIRSITFDLQLTEAKGGKLVWRGEEVVYSGASNTINDLTGIKFAQRMLDQLINDGVVDPR
jgi:hypothetical protein